jgi:allantoinase
MLPSDRLAYSPITQREPLSLPGGARMVVWTIVNVEAWDATQPMPRTVITPAAGGSPIPDIPNWCWHEYGNRVGFWRLLEIYDKFEIPGVMNINGSALAAYPEIVQAAAQRKWEFVGHGFTQRNMQKVPNEREDIRNTAEAIAKVLGKQPRGWLGRDSPRHGRRPTSSKTRATTTSLTGFLTTNPYGLRREASRSSVCPTRRNATTWR